MTYTEIIDEGVETFEYCPRSFVEQLPPDPTSTPSSPKSCENNNNNNNNNNKSVPKRGSFTELRNTILTKVSTPRGHRRSKTQIKRVPKESTSNATTKHKVRRTTSLDLLGNIMMRKQNGTNTASDKSYQKCMEEDLMKGFSQMIVGMSLPATTTEDSEVNSGKTGDSTTGKNLTVRYPYKDRSMSCPSYPSIKEETTPTIVKSASYDSAAGYMMNQPTKSCPVTIKVDFCKTDNNSIIRTVVPKSAPLQRRKHSKNKWQMRSGGDNSKSASTSSLCSVKTADSSSSTSYLSGSDNSSVFNSDHSLNSGHQRPVSYIDFFKRENQEEFSSSNTLPRGGSTTKTDCNCNTLLQQSSIDLTGSDIDFMDHHTLRDARSRASSMIEIGNKKKSTKTESSPSTKKHEQLKKTTSNIYGFASPTLLKKIFKKKISSLPNNNKKNKKTVTAPCAPCLKEGGHPDEHHQRKCVHIESFV